MIELGIVVSSTMWVSINGVSLNRVSAYGTGGTEAVSIRTAALLSWAPFLGVSRARVPQVLKRLEEWLLLVNS